LTFIFIIFVLGKQTCQPGTKLGKFLATANKKLFTCNSSYTAVARLSHHNSVHLSVRHMGGSVKNGAS